MKLKLLILLTTIIFGLVLSNQAATITVTNTDDSGVGSLRNAIGTARDGRYD